MFEFEDDMNGNNNSLPATERMKGKKNLIRRSDNN